MKILMITMIVGLLVGISVVSSTGFYHSVEANSETEPNLSVRGDACRNVKFQFKNNHRSGRTVDIVEVEYFNRANGRWQTENIKGNNGDSFYCPFGDTCTTRGDDLRDSEGEQITKIRFHFKFAVPGGWSDKIVSRQFEPVAPVCNANKTYGDGQNWTIGEQ